MMYPLCNRNNITLSIEFQTKIKEHLMLFFTKCGIGTPEVDTLLCKIVLENLNYDLLNIDHVVSLINTVYFDGTEIYLQNDNKHNQFPVFAKINARFTNVLKLGEHRLLVPMILLKQHYYIAPANTEKYPCECMIIFVQYENLSPIDIIYNTDMMSTTHSDSEIQSIVKVISASTRNRHELNVICLKLFNKCLIRHGLPIIGETYSV